MPPDGEDSSRTSCSIERDCPRFHALCRIAADAERLAMLGLCRDLGLPVDEAPALELAASLEGYRPSGRTPDGAAFYDADLLFALTRMGRPPVPPDVPGAFRAAAQLQAAEDRFRAGLDGVARRLGLYRRPRDERLLAILCIDLADFLSGWFH